MTNNLPTVQEISQIFALEHVENIESPMCYYYNWGTLQSVSSLIAELKNSNVDPTVICFTPAHDPQNCYYTPKTATRKPGNQGWE